MKDKILSIRFNDDGSKIASTSTDLAYGIIDVATGTTKFKKNPHETKAVTRAVIAHTGDVYSAGEDCAIRVWSGI